MLSTQSVFYSEMTYASAQWLVLKGGWGFTYSLSLSLCMSLLCVHDEADHERWKYVRWAAQGVLARFRFVVIYFI